VLQAIVGYQTVLGRHADTQETLRQLSEDQKRLLKNCEA
jgi:hypothetical protein